MARHPIIVLWTTPRSRSTAFERMMIERGDHTVIDEPFSARYYFSAERRSDRFAEQEPGATAAAVIDDLLAAAAERPVFVKDMAYHVTGVLSPELLGEFTNTFLVREPAATLSSLARKWPDFTPEEAGYDALDTAHRIAVDLLGSPPPVIEADDLANDPPGITSAWCAAVGIPFHPGALTWAPGMVPQWTRWQDWYEGVADSTGFRPPGSTVADRRPALEETARRSVERAEVVYDRLVRHRLAAS